jgi:hypothetical protein
VLVIHFLIQPLVAYLQGSSVDDDYHITHIHTGGIGGLVLAKQICADLGCQASNSLPVCIHQKPFWFLFSF